MRKVLAAVIVAAAAFATSGSAATNAPRMTFAPEKYPSPAKIVKTHHDFDAVWYFQTKNPHPINEYGFNRTDGWFAAHAGGNHVSSGTPHYGRIRSSIDPVPVEGSEWFFKYKFRLPKGFHSRRQGNGDTFRLWDYGATSSEPDRRLALKWRSGSTHLIFERQRVHSGSEYTQILDLGHTRARKTITILGHAILSETGGLALTEAWKNGNYKGSTTQANWVDVSGVGPGVIDRISAGLDGWGDQDERSAVIKVRRVRISPKPFAGFPTAITDARLRGGYTPAIRTA